MTARRNPRLPAPVWYGTTGSDQDVAVSTRCRIARNLEGFTFPWIASDQELAEVCRLCAQGVASVEPHALSITRPVTEPGILPDLVAARYASFRWAGMERPGRVHIAPDGSWSAMVNEEDHLRFQVVLSGFEPAAAVSRCRDLAASLGRRLAFVRHPDYGWLTASLTNAGTGMRLSFLLHLAALASGTALMEAVEAAGRMGCVVRGAFGEGTPGTGAFVQVSNRCTWGPDAAEAVGRACGAGRYLIEREREARQVLIDRRGGLSDLADASDGARERVLRDDLHPLELMHSVSVLRLGIATGATPGDIVRTGEWIAAAGVVAWTHAAGRNEPYERMRRLATIRSGLRQ